MHGALIQLCFPCCAQQAGGRGLGYLGWNWGTWGGTGSRNIMKSERSWARTESGPITPGFLCLWGQESLGSRLLLPAWQMFYFLLVSAERPKCSAEDGGRENQTPLFFFLRPSLLLLWVRAGKVSNLTHPREWLCKVTGLSAPALLRAEPQLSCAAPDSVCVLGVTCAPSHLCAGVFERILCW